MATNIKLKIDSEIHNHLDHAFDFLDFSDDQNDTYDEPYNKTTFDSFVDPNGTVTWKAEDMNNGTQLSITNIVFDSPPRGFFTSNPSKQKDGTWKAIVGINNSDKPIACEYTITFDDGQGDTPIPIDPKLQIRKN